MINYSNFDEIFKTLMKDYFEQFAVVITDYEITKLPKTTDLLIIEIEENFRNNLKFYDYFKKYNGIEFKSPADSFKIGIDDYKLGFYLNGILLQEKEANTENTTFTVVASKKPIKFFKKYKDKIKKVKNGLYIIDGIAVIPIYFAIIKEIPLIFEEEYKILKEFSVGKDRIDYFKLLVKNIDKFDDKYIQIAISLYGEEFYKILKEAGYMTLVQRNIFRVAELTGLKDSLIDEGKKEGIKEGEKKGKKEGKKEAAKGMKENGINVNLISKITGLTIEEINKL